MNLTLFLANGKTLHFEDVEILDNENDTLVFEYTGVSTGRRRRAEFVSSGFIGYAIDEQG